MLLNENKKYRHAIGLTGINPPPVPDFRTQHTQITTHRTVHYSLTLTEGHLQYACQDRLPGKTQ